MALASAGATSYVVALSVPYPSGTLARWVASTWMPNDLQREEHRSRGRVLRRQPPTQRRNNAARAGTRRLDGRLQPVATLRVCVYIDQQEKQILDPRAFGSKSE